MTEFVGLSANTYSFLMNDFGEIKKNKGRKRMCNKNKA